MTDLVLTNGRFTTLAGDGGTASAVAISGGKFTAVGSEADVLKAASDGTRVIDLRGRRVVPGLIDSHTHVIRGGLNYNLELRWDGVSSLADALALL
jgi:predicted amidohydrolase YtcJ